MTTAEVSSRSDIKKLYEQLEFMPTPEQEEILSSRYRFTQIAGGEQGGKSVTVSKYFWERFGESARDGSDEYWLVGQDYNRTTREFRYLSMDAKRLGLLKSASKRNDPGEIILKDGTKIITKSAKDPTSLAMVAPRGIMACEAGIMDHWVYELMEGRTAGKRGWLFLTGTFETSVGWYPMIWESWQSGANNRKSYSLPSWSNTFLYPGGRWDPEIVRLETEHSEEYFMERIAGKPVPPKGRVFKEFTPDVHIAKHEWDPMEPVYIWEDPGYGGGNIHAHAIEVFQYIMGQLRGIDEVYEHGLTTEDMIDICQTRPWWKSPKFLVSDPHYKDQHHSMNSVAEQWMAQTGLRAAGDRIKILPGIERMKSLLKMDPITHLPRITFHPKMVGILSEFGAVPNPFDGQSHVYSWKVDNDGTAYGEVPIDSANDAIKAVIYGAIVLLGYPSTLRTNNVTRVKRHLGTRRQSSLMERRRAQR